MKKITALCLCFIMLFPLTFIVEADTSDGQRSKAERFMIGSGIFSMQYNPDEELTRAEFAAILSNALRLVDKEKSWNDTAKGKDTTEVTISANLFDDVDASHPYYDEIMAVKQRGIMSGISENLFAPEYSITLKEVQKVILSLMGYGVLADMNGGYPQGYTKEAQIIGLTKGLKCTADDAITKQDVIKLLYNAMNVKLFENTDFVNMEYKTSDETFMTGVLKIGKIKGVVTDNGYTAIDGASGIKHGSITVSSITAELSQNTLSAVKYLGRSVEMYYTENKADDVNTAVYIEEAEDMNVITFKIDDFVSFKDNKISFDVNDKLNTATLNKNAEMIINNEVCKSFDASTFNFTDGDVTLTNDDGGYNTVIVNQYEYAVISNIDSDKMVAYNKLQGGGAAYKYDFSGLTVDQACIDILNDKGEKITFADLGVEDILNIRKSGNYMEVVKTGQVISQFTVTTFSKDNDKSTITNGDKTYETSAFFEGLSNRINPAVSEKYNLYLNISGKIIWMEHTTSDTVDLMGILTKAGYDESKLDGTQGYIKIYTDDGEFGNYYVGETIRVNGKSVKYKNIIKTLEAAVGELVLYNCDADGILNKITIASEFGTDEKLGWYKIAPKGEYYYEGQGLAFSTMFYSGDNTMKFTMPENKADFDDADNFSVNKLKFSDATYYTLQPYARNKDSVTADAVLLQKEAASGGTLKEGEAFLISQVVHTINDDGDPILQFKGYKFKIVEDAHYAEYTVADDAVMVGFGEVGTPIAADADINVVGPRTYKELEAGDIIYFNTNIKDEIETIRIAYDCSNRKPFNASRGGDFYDHANDGTYTSPVNTTWSGTVISRVGSDIRFATNYNPANINYSDFSDVVKKVKTNVIRNTGSLIVVDKQRNKVNAVPGMLSNILSYNETGSANDADDVVILAYWRSYDYGTIIYKK